MGLKKLRKQAVEARVQLIHKLASNGQWIKADYLGNSSLKS